MIDQIETISFLSVESPGVSGTTAPHGGRAKSAFSKYNKAILIRTTDPRMGQEVAVAIEKEAMITFGLRFSFAMALCVQCEECSYPDPCRFPHLARPSMDAYGVDVEKTLEPLKLKVDFDKDGKLLPVWYSLVLLD